MIYWEPIKEDTIFDRDKNYFIADYIENNGWNLLISNDDRTQWYVDSVSCGDIKQPIDLEKVKKDYKWYSELNLP